MNRAPVLVQKFGGTSVSTPERRAQVVEHVRRARAEGYDVTIVVSAMGRRGEPYATDTLLDLLRSDGGPVAPADYDLMFSCGETIAAAIVSQALTRAGIPAVGLTSAQAHIYTDGLHVEASITEIDTARLVSLMSAGQVPVVTGGQGVAPATLDVTTLGRGGSDTSGVALGAALGARRVDIFTDVDGVAVADPRVVPGARFLARVSYASMYELARFGAKVVHPRALATGWSSRTPIVVRSTLSNAPGTLVAEVEDESPLVGLALLPPMDTVVLPAGAVDLETRASWEQVRLVMSLADDGGEQLLVGAADDKSSELRAALSETAAQPTRPAERCCWLSVIGDAAALEEHHPRWVKRFGDHAVTLRAHELTERRCTYVIPEAARAAAASLIYEAFGKL
jgi:aspartate kinase